MPNPVGTVLRELGIYKPLRKTISLLTDTHVRQNALELREDFILTRQQVGDWAALGKEHADPNRMFAILSFTNLPLHAKFHCMVAKAMQLRGYTPVIFTYSGCRHAHKYFELFGIDEHLIMWDEYAQELPLDGDTVQSVVKALLPATPKIEDVLACQFHGVDIGKHALSVTARKRIEGNLNLDDPETFTMLRQYLSETIRSVLISRRFFDDYPIEKVLVRDAGYIPNGGIYETALTRDLDCVVYEQGQQRGTWIVKRYDKTSKGQHYFSLSDSTWETIKQEPWTPEEDARLEAVFAGRYQPDSTDDTRRLMSGKKLKTPEEVRDQLGLDPAKKTAVIFSHIAWDAAFFFGSCLFDDFEDWLFQTVKFVARECPDVNWIVKLHPFNVFKLQRENKQEESEIRLLQTLMPLPDHVKIMRANTDINTQSLFPVIDYVLTVNGTVGMEFPCYGVPALLGGTGRYNGRGFTIEPQTQDEFYTMLKTLHHVDPLNDQTRDLARKHFLTVTQRRQTNLDDIMPMQLKRLNEAQSDVHDNISISARSLEEFRASESMTRFADWIAFSMEPDLLEPAK